MRRVLLQLALCMVIASFMGCSDNKNEKDKTWANKVYMLAMKPAMEAQGKIFSGLEKLVFASKEALPADSCLTGKVDAFTLGCELPGVGGKAKISGSGSKATDGFSMSMVVTYEGYTDALKNVILGSGPLTFAYTITNLPKAPLQYTADDIVNKSAATVSGKIQVSGTFSESVDFALTIGGHYCSKGKVAGYDLELEGGCSPQPDGGGYMPDQAISDGAGGADGQTTVDGIKVDAPPKVDSNKVDMSKVDSTKVDQTSKLDKGKVDK